MPVSRRQFFTWASMSAAGAVIAAPLKAFYAQEAVRSRLGDGRSKQASQLILEDVGYGALQPDPNGLLDLPAGFRYHVLSREGDIMNDGHPVPGAFDGMAAFADAHGNTVLIRNHELLPDSSTQIVAPAGNQYDPHAKGGTTTVVIGGDRTLLRQYTSLAGTCRNCSGGATPWNSWISCEEDTSTPATSGWIHRSRVSKPHGYAFEVPIAATAAVTPEPLVAMGRFKHEAIAVDPRTGVVYQTEDQIDGLFYRFIPHTPGQLQAGGVLEALCIQGRSQAITRANVPIGQPMPVEWVRIAAVDPVEDTVRMEGFAKGAAQFSRGEGICYSNGELYFTCTNGGNRPYGQVWRYIPGLTVSDGGTIELFVQPDNATVLDFPDNLVMAPSGDLMICEDGRGAQYVVGLTPTGRLYKFARNAINRSEFAGICFSPNGQTMFLNIYQPGITFAIWSEP
ncbi:DUF839 domain-containing protein [Oculatella sp. LEGE 06141]|uniref:alkaline phosphatase PhoX n=1 Tax=Oculatella sp. LEGE 06141 TaxID=1828648 RepID=UPI001882E510|nr:alkaline phosphatase PhoX [Oculatella sp. LEGE 06141]MBE9179812.1 DUF839 domain-containing protein [Oculatella sp. LEGE 06141]